MRGVQKGQHCSEDGEGRRQCVRRRVLGAAFGFGRGSFGYRTSGGLVGGIGGRRVWVRRLLRNGGESGVL